MYILLPNDAGKFNQVVQKITPGILQKYSWLMEEQPVDVIIPKFKFDFSTHLKKNLQEVWIG